MLSGAQFSVVFLSGGNIAENKIWGDRRIVGLWANIGDLVEKRC